MSSLLLIYGWGAFVFGYFRPVDERMAWISYWLMCLGLDASPTVALNFATALKLASMVLAIHAAHLALRVRTRPLPAT